MSQKEIDKIVQLAKDRIAQGVSTAKALETFVKAGILTEKGNLKKAFKTSEEQEGQTQAVSA
jgi:hypothetical protein